MKKFVCLALSLMTVLAMFTGCGSKTETPAEDTAANNENNAAATENTPAEDTAAEETNGTTEALSGTVNTDGSTSMNEMMLIMMEVFEEMNPDVTVNYSGTGSGAGIEAVLNETVDIGLASRALKDEEKANGAVEHIVALDGVAVVGGRRELGDYCLAASLDEVIISADRATEESLKEEMENIAAMGLTIHLQIPVLELKEAPQRILSQFGKLHMITYANKVAPFGQLMLKRLLDIVGALVGTVILVILTIVLTPIIKLDSPGPVFFAQKRVGRNGRIFRMYKFRSMYIDAEERKKELMAQNEMNGLMFKMEDDPRITKVGKFLRKTSLDEFPQFINILKGDMSLVGTRPPTLDEFEQYKTYHKKRLSFRPGLTGMWQVSGRSDITDFEEIVRLDVEYINNWSVSLDIKILIKTVLAVFAESGAK